MATLSFTISRSDLYEAECEVTISGSLSMPDKSNYFVAIEAQSDTGTWWEKDRESVSEDYNNRESFTFYISFNEMRQYSVRAILGYDDPEEGERTLLTKTRTIDLRPSSWKWSPTPYAGNLWKTEQIGESSYIAYCPISGDQWSEFIDWMDEWVSEYLNIEIPREYFYWALDGVYDKRDMTYVQASGALLMAITLAGKNTDYDLDKWLNKGTNRGDPISAQFFKDLSGAVNQRIQQKKDSEDD